MRTESPGQLTGRLFGGEAGSGQACAVEFSGRAVLADVGGVRHEFPFGVATLAVGGNQDSMVVLTHAGLTLYLPREAAFAAMRAAGSVTLDRELAALTVGVRSRSRRAAGAVLAVLIALIVTVVGLYLTVDRILEWAILRVPPAWEVALGKAVAGRLHGLDKPLLDPAVRAGIDPITERLLAAMPTTGYRYEFHVIVSEQVNAFALPGGQITIYTGLIEKCERPEELAGVLAHEIQHVAKRHSLLAITRAVKWQILLSLLVGDLGSVQEVVIGRAADLFSLGNGRDAEREADREGLDLLYAARVDPAGMVRFFEVLQKEEASGGKSLSFLSTHPGGVERIDAIRAGIEARGGAGAIEPLAVDWESLRNAIKESGIEHQDKE